MEFNIVNTLNKYKVKILDIKNANSNIKTKEYLFFKQNIKKIYVINMINNNLRRKYIYLIMKKLGIDFTFVIVYPIKNDINNLLNPKNFISKSELGCTLSHLWCLNDLINNNYNNAIIFEDDIIFHKNFFNLFHNIYSDKFNLLLLGACDFSFKSFHKEKVMNNLYTIDNNSSKTYGAHANYYSLNGAKKMFELQTNNNELSFFDKNYKDIFNFFNMSLSEKTAFICYPNLIVSDISTSNLKHDYPFFSILEKNYYDKCFVNFCFNDYHFIYLHLLKEYQNIKIEKTDDYEKYLKKILYIHFYNFEKMKIIKNRLDLEFFSINDIRVLIS
jgi:glycosyl transferase family 25